MLFEAKVMVGYLYLALLLALQQKTLVSQLLGLLAHTAWTQLLGLLGLQRQPLTLLARTHPECHTTEL